MTIFTTTYFSLYLRGIRSVCAQSDLHVKTILRIPVNTCSFTHKAVGVHAQCKCQHRSVTELQIRLEPSIGTFEAVIFVTCANVHYVHLHVFAHTARLSLNCKCTRTQANLYTQIDWGVCLQILLLNWYPKLLLLHLLFLKRYGW